MNFAFESRESFKDRAMLLLLLLLFLKISVIKEAYERSDFFFIALLYLPLTLLLKPLYQFIRLSIKPQR